MNPKLLSCVIASFMLSGCLGTFSSRDCDVVGKYPGMAIAEDFRVMGTPGPYGTGWLAVIALISLPVDIVVDTVLLPVDLIAWPFGLKRFDF